MQSLIIKQDGKVYYIAAYHIHSSETIRKAISSAILVKNQEYALRLIKDVFPEEAAEMYAKEVAKHESIDFAFFCLNRHIDEDQLSDFKNKIFDQFRKEKGV